MTEPNERTNVGQARSFLIREFPRTAHLEWLRLLMHEHLLVDVAMHVPQEPVERRVDLELARAELERAIQATLSETCGEGHHQGHYCMEPPEHRGNHRAWSTALEDDQPWFVEWPNEQHLGNLEVWRTTHCRQKYPRREW